MKKKTKNSDEPSLIGAKPVKILKYLTASDVSVSKKVKQFDVNISKNQKNK